MRRRRSWLFVLLALLFVLGSPSPAGAQPAPPLPPDFLWGTASSGFQSEGVAPESNWSRFANSGRTADPYLNSVDFYHRYSEDIALAADLGAKVYRIGVEWARVQPRPGVWDESAFAFYDNVVGAIQAAGMRPMITLDHWVYPGWVADQGAWRNPKTVTDWIASASRVIDRYAPRNPLWVTINETVPYVSHEIDMGALSPWEAPTMFDRLAQVHNAAYDHIHAVQPGAMVTSNVAYLPAVEAVPDALFLDKIKLDYVGIDYYYGASLQALPTMVATRDLILEPEGIYYVLRHYARKFPGRPLYIVENGMPTDNGRERTDGYRRADALRDTIYWVQRAKADGFDVIGYNYWSITDNYEWGSYSPRFGLYTVDVKADPSLTRRPTEAVGAYRQITAAGGVPAGYRPTRPPALCSFQDNLSSCLDPAR